MSQSRELCRLVSVVPENSADDSPDICGGKDELLPWNRRLHSWKERKDFSPTSVPRTPKHH